MKALDPDQEAELAQFLIHEFYGKTRHYAGWQFYQEAGPAYFSTEEGKTELQRQLFDRLNWFSNAHMPWLASQLELGGARVLEVGTGTGVSAVALLGAGASKVVGVDVDKAALSVASKRVELHGYAAQAEFYCVNATEIHRFSDFDFDLILFFATIEHMTHSERMATLPVVWNRMMQPGSLLCILDTPNRLWVNDRHTALMPFFHWLPDDVALDYARFSTRQSFADDFADIGPDAVERLARWGRGVSFHDFDLWFGKSTWADEVVGMDEYNREKSPEWAEAWAKTDDGIFYNCLRSYAPHVPAPFFGEALNLVVRKPGAAVVPRDEYTSVKLKEPTSSSIGSATSWMRGRLMGP